jgi:glucose-6-phosphate dehydrogenase assembly protein OpcA
MSAAVTADGILSELHKLWASLAVQPASAESEAVLRASAMTLIVVAEEGDDAGAISQTIAEVMREHPNRAVVVHVRASAEPLLESRVTAQCWLPFGTRRQVCCEQIEITASEASLPGLAPILLAITAPDLPIVMWCRGARIFSLPAMGPALERAGKVIVDSKAFPEPGAALGEFASQIARGRRVSDLSWARITRWRETVAQIFEDPARRELVCSFRQARVLHAGAAPPATAYYLGGWLLSSCGNADLEVRLESVSETAGGIQGLLLTSDSHTIAIRRTQGGPAVQIEIDSLKSCTVVPRLDETALLSAELGIASRDAVFERTLPVAARLAQRRDAETQRTK